MTRSLLRGPRALVGLLGILAATTTILATPRVKTPIIELGVGQEHSLSVTETSSLRQTFIPPQDGIDTIVLFPAEPPPPNTVLKFQLRTAHPQKDLRTVTGPVEKFLNGSDQRLVVSFVPLDNVRGILLALDITAPGGKTAQAVRLRYEIDGNKYTEGNLWENGRAHQGDIALKIIAREDILSSWRISFERGTAGQWFAALLLVLLGGFLALDLRDAHRGAHVPFWRLAFLASLALAVAYTFPWYAHLAYWADTNSDWPEVISTYAAARLALSAGEPPWWNPFICGGTPNFANPQTYFLSPGFLFALALGDSVGPKIAAPLVLAIGMVGMMFLARELGLKGLAAMFPAPLALMSGFTTAHLGNGQFLWLTLAWIPWILLGYYRSLRRPWWVLLAAGGLMGIFIEGRVYLVAYTALLLVFLALASSIQRRSLVPLRRCALIGLLTILLSAWKLFPALAFLHDAGASLEKTDGVPWAALPAAFLRRSVTPNQLETFGDRQIAEHEYAAYVGVGTLLFAAGALRRRHLATVGPFIISGALFLFLATQRGESSFLLHIPLVKELRNPSRMISMVVIALSLLAGYGYQNMREWLRTRLVISPRVGSLILAAGAVATVVNLFRMSQPVFAHEFTITPADHSFETPGFFQTRMPSDTQPANGYPAIVQGKGAKEFCPAVLQTYRPERNITAREDEGYRGEMFLAGSGKLRNQNIRVNTLTATVESAAPTKLIVNQLFDRGWSAYPYKTSADDTRLAVDLPAGTQQVVIRYRPPFIVPGLLVTTSTLLAAGYLYIRRRTSVKQVGERPRT